MTRILVIHKFIAYLYLNRSDIFCERFVLILFFGSNKIK